MSRWFYLVTFSLLWFSWFLFYHWYASSGAWTETATDRQRQAARDRDKHRDRERDGQRCIYICKSWFKCELFFAIASWLNNPHYGQHYTKVRKLSEKCSRNSDDPAVEKLHIGSDFYGGASPLEPDSKFVSKPVGALKAGLVKDWDGGRSGSLLQDGFMEL